MQKEQALDAMKWDDKHQKRGSTNEPTIKQENHGKKCGDNFIFIYNIIIR